MNFRPEAGLQLEGVKTSYRNANKAFASGVVQKFAQMGCAVYCIVEENASAITDRRRERRYVTRLRSGKAISDSDDLIADCTILNRSRFGLRLQFSSDKRLPKTICFYDDQSKTLCKGTVVWQRGKVAGCRLAPLTISNRPKLLKRFEWRYYAQR